MNNNQKLWTRLFLQSLAIPAIQILFDILLREIWVSRGGSKFDGMIYATGLFACWALSYVFVSTGSLLSVWRRRVGIGAAAVFAFVHTCLLATNFFLFRYFGEYLFPGALAFIFDPSYLSDYVQTFIGFVPVVALLLTWALFFYCLFPRDAVRSPSRLQLAGATVIALVVLTGGIIALHANETKSEFRMPPDVVAVESLAKHTLRVRHKIWPLRPSQRIPLHTVKWASASGRPRTILLMVHESMGTRSLTFMDGVRLYGGAHGGMPRLARRMKRDSASFVVFQKAYTNAVATQVSMASLFSGVSPEESHRKLHCMPMFWDMAKAAGYKTAYFSSQRLRWATLSDFLMKQPLDTLVAREQTDYPPVNDMGIDDFHVVKTIENWLAANPDEPLFIVWNTNALHSPHQESSEFMDLSLVPGGRYEKALQLVDSAMEKVFVALETSGRLEDALIMSTADHGEDPDPFHSLSRINSYYDEYTRIPLWIRMPRSLRDGRFSKAARARVNVPVANIDVAPTLAHLFGLRPKASDHKFPATCSIESGKLPWEGQSLFGRVVDTDRVLTTLSTNDIRHWDGDGFGLVRGPWRLVLLPDSGRALYNIEADPGQVHNVLKGASDSVMDPFLRHIDGAHWLRTIYNHHRKREGWRPSDSTRAR